MIQTINIVNLPKIIHKKCLHNEVLALLVLFTLIGLIPTSKKLSLVNPFF